MSSSSSSSSYNDGISETSETVAFVNLIPRTEDLPPKHDDAPAISSRRESNRGPLLALNDGRTRYRRRDLLFSHAIRRDTTKENAFLQLTTTAVPARTARLPTALDYPAEKPPHPTQSSLANSRMLFRPPSLNLDNDPVMSNIVTQTQSVLRQGAENKDRQRRLIQHVQDKVREWTKSQARFDESMHWKQESRLHYRRFQTQSQQALQRRSTSRPSSAVAGGGGGGGEQRRVRPLSAGPLGSRGGGGGGGGGSRSGGGGVDRDPRQDIAGDDDNGQSDDDAMERYHHVSRGWSETPDSIAAGLRDVRVKERRAEIRRRQSMDYAGIDGNMRAELEEMNRRILDDSDDDENDREMARKLGRRDSVEIAASAQHYVPPTVKVEAWEEDDGDAIEEENRYKWRVQGARKDHERMRIAKEARAKRIAQRKARLEKRRAAKNPNWEPPKPKPAMRPRSAAWNKKNQKDPNAFVAPPRPQSAMPFKIGKGRDKKKKKTLKTFKGRARAKAREALEARRKANMPRDVGFGRAFIRNEWHTVDNHTVIDERPDPSIMAPTNMPQQGVELVATASRSPETSPPLSPTGDGPRTYPPSSFVPIVQDGPEYQPRSSSPYSGYHTRPLPREWYDKRDELRSDAMEKTLAAEQLAEQARSEMLTAWNDRQAARQEKAEMLGTKIKYVAKPPKRIANATFHAKTKEYPAEQSQVPPPRHLSTEYLRNAHPPPSPQKKPTNLLLKHHTDIIASETSHERRMHGNSESDQVHISLLQNRIAVKHGDVTRALVPPHVTHDISELSQLPSPADFLIRDPTIVIKKKTKKKRRKVRRRKKNFIEPRTIMSTQELARLKAQRMEAARQEQKRQENVRNAVAAEMDAARFQESQVRDKIAKEDSARRREIMENRRRVMLAKEQEEDAALKMRSEKERLRVLEEATQKEMAAKKEREKQEARRLAMLRE